MKESGPSLRAASFEPSAGGTMIRRLLTTRQQKTLAALSTRINIDARQVLYREGAPAGFVYICGSGALKAFRDLPSGKRRILAFMFEDDAFGLAENGRYVNSVQALKKTVCYRIAREALMPVLRQDPELGWQFLCKITHELRESQRRALMVGRRSAIGRLAMFLKMLERHNPDGCSTNSIAMPMSRSEIADYLGLSLESVSRAGGQLVRERIVAFDGPHQARIIDRARLDRFAADT